MKYYFYIKNNKEQGPFSLDELKEKTINHSTLVWTEGLSDWIKASDLDEIKYVIVSKLPPTPKLPPIPKKLDNREYDAMFTGVLLIPLTLIISFFEFKEHSFILFVSILAASFILRICCTIWVYNIAKRLNRNTLGWSIFVFFFLTIALIIIGLLNKRDVVDE